MSTKNKKIKNSGNHLPKPLFHVQWDIIGRKLLTTRLYFGRKREDWNIHRIVRLPKGLSEALISVLTKSDFCIKRIPY